MGAFLSDEEDSADSTTDSDTVVEPAQLSPSVGGNSSTTSLRRSSGSGRLLASSPGLVSLSGRNAEEDRVTGVDRCVFDGCSWFCCCCYHHHH